VALTDQLCGRYLRAKDARYGILLLVHRKARKLGWRVSRRGSFLKFGQLVDHLRALAVRIMGNASYAPQPEIGVLNVSSTATEKDRP